MKYILFALLIILSSFSFADTSKVPIQIAPIGADNAQGCAIKNGKIEPYNRCIDSDDILAGAIFSVFPSALDWVGLNYFKESDIVGSDNIFENEESLTRLLEDEQNILDFFNTTSGISLSGIGGVFFCLLIFYYTKNHLIVKADGFYVNDNWLHEIFKTAVLLVFVMPMFSGYTGFAIVILKAAVIGISIANFISGMLGSSLQVNDSMTDTSEIETVIENTSGLVKNQNYAISHNYFKELSKMANANLISENETRNSYSEYKTVRYMSLTKTKMLDKEFTSSNTLYMKSVDVDVNVRSGDIKAKFVNFDNLDPKTKDYAKKISYSSILENSVAQLTIDNAGDITSKGWAETEERLKSELGTLDSEKVRIINVFLEHYMQYMNSALFMKNEIDGKSYSKSFDYIYKKANEVAVLANTADCLRNTEVSGVNIRLEKQNKSYSCGYFDEEGNYHTLLLKSGVGTTPLKLSAENIIKETVIKITKARLEIEKVRFTAAAKYQNFGEWAEFRNEGWVSLTKILKYSADNSINNKLMNLRQSVSVEASLDDLGYGQGNQAFDEIISSATYSRATEETLDSMFASTAPVRGLGENVYVGAESIESSMNSSVATETSKKNTFSFENPFTTMKNSWSMIKTAELNKEGVESCFTPEKLKCPFSATDYPKGMHNFSEKLFTEASSVYAVAFALSIGADVLHSYDNSVIKKEAKKSKKEADDALKNGGELSVKHTDTKGDVSNEKSKKKKKSKKISNSASAMGIISEIVMDGASDVMLASGAVSVITDVAQYVYHIKWIIFYAVMVAYYVIFASFVLSVLVIRGELQQAFRYISLITVKLVIYPPILATVAIIANAILQTSFMIFGVLILHLSLMLESLGGDSILQIFYYITVGFLFMVFIAVIFKLVLDFCYGAFLSKFFEIVDTNADAEHAGSVMNNLQVYTTMMVSELTSYIKDSRYRKREARLKSRDK